MRKRGWLIRVSSRIKDPRGRRLLTLDYDPKDREVEPVDLFIYIYRRLDTDYRIGLIAIDDEDSQQMLTQLYGPSVRWNLEFRWTINAFIHNLF